MEIEAGLLLSPEPIKLSMGTLRKPTLREISRLTFMRFGIYEVFLKLSPEVYYNEVQKDSGGVAIWDSMPEDKKESLTIFDVIVSSSELQKIYCEVLNFFFEETVVFLSDFFAFLHPDIEPTKKITVSDIKGIANADNFESMLECIQQTCCIYEKKVVEETPTFKSKIAEKMYAKIKKAEAEEKKRRQSEVNKDFLLHNIISAVSNRHPSINPINVWDLTIYQLIDSFGRLQVNAIYDIDSTRVSVWGDEKKTFDIALWYKNKQDDNPNK